MKVLSRLIPADAVIAVDVGNNTYSFGRYFECSQQSILMSGYLGSIGFGYPAAMGAWAADPAADGLGDGAAQPELRGIRRHLRGQGRPRR